MRGPRIQVVGRTDPAFENCISICGLPHKGHRALGPVKLEGWMRSGNGTLMMMKRSIMWMQAMYGIHRAPGAGICAAACCQCSEKIRNRNQRFVYTTLSQTPANAVIIPRRPNTRATSRSEYTTRPPLPPLPPPHNPIPTPTLLLRQWLPCLHRHLLPHRRINRHIENLMHALHLLTTTLHIRRPHLLRDTRALLRRHGRQALGFQQVDAGAFGAEVGFQADEDEGGCGAEV